MRRQAKPEANLSSRVGAYRDRLSAVHLDFFVFSDALVVQELGHLLPVVTRKLDEQFFGVGVLFHSSVTVELLT